MILVTGATGFLGKRVCQLLESTNVEFTPTSKSLGVDLRNRSEALALFEQLSPKYVLNCASFVGGIQFGQKQPVEIFQHNLQMTLNLLEASQRFNVSRLVNPYPIVLTPVRQHYLKKMNFGMGRCMSQSWFMVL